MLECFKRRELLQWAGFLVKYEEVLREGMPDCSATEVFVTDTELGKQQWEDLRKRVIEHVSSIFYCLSTFNEDTVSYTLYRLIAACVSMK